MPVPSPSWPAEIERLATRAAAGELTPPDLAGATFTLTDLGRFPVTRVGALLHPARRPRWPPARCRLCRWSATEPSSRGSRIALTLAADARILSGCARRRFLAAVAAALAG